MSTAILERFAASSAMPEEARPFAQHIRELMDGQQLRHQQIMGDLSAHEIILLGGPNEGRTSWSSPRRPHDPDR